MVENINKIAISEFKATCLKVLDQVKKTGNPIYITKRGELIAMVSPPPPKAESASWLGAFKGDGRIVGDVISPVVDEDEWEVLK
jgi:prevent-host-death family protein